MDACRMARRGLRVLSASSARLADHQLRFNKRASNLPAHAYANVIPSPGACVEGVLYELADRYEIERMDPFEGTPVRYRRELLVVNGARGETVAWVYIAQPAFIEEGLLPTRWYLDHLRAGALWLSASYRQILAQQPCDEAHTEEPPKRPLQHAEEGSAG